MGHLRELIMIRMHRHRLKWRSVLMISMLTALKFSFSSWIKYIRFNISWRKVFFILSYYSCRVLYHSRHILFGDLSFIFRGYYFGSWDIYTFYWLVLCLIFVFLLFIYFLFIFRNINMHIRKNNSVRRTYPALHLAQLLFLCFSIFPLLQLWQYNNILLLCQVLHGLFIPILKFLSILLLLCSIVNIFIEYFTNLSLTYFCW